MEDLASDLHGFAEGFGSSGNHEELLEGKLIAGVLPSVDDVEARDGKNIRGRVASDIGIVLPKRDAPGGRSSLACRERDCREREKVREYTKFLTSSV